MLGLLAGVALVIAVLALVLVARSDDGSSGIVSDLPESSAPTTVPTTSTTTGPMGTVAADDPPDSIAPTLPTTTSATTLPPEPALTSAMTLPPPESGATPAPAAPITVADTVPASPPPPPPAPVTAIATTSPATDAPPPIPAPAPPVTSPADANVLAEPFPSGVSSADVGRSLTLTQQFSDALAAGDWESARRLNPSLRALSDAEFEDGYGGLDRATQLLVDAQQTSSGDRLLLVTIANERAGAQTTLYCVESTVSVDGAVRQTAASVLERYPGTIGVAEVTSDPAITDLIRRQCVLT